MQENVEVYNTSKIVRDFKKGKNEEEVIVCHKYPTNTVRPKL
jgi:hypothetical protein